MAKHYEFGLAKNVTDQLQSWGSFQIEPHTIGRLPMEVIEDLRKHPIKELVVVDDHPDLCPWVRTEHKPDSLRYRG